ncbi:RagB/SusD family nutrient uptake outer membrane protein [Carboxylicivirga marina]|uniref:RagB/SusD family nutrient uptake outer membrane protein n=1 Tax=Carboxylicivirga marina TaxID=2800988 RepID=A0ABS1HR65_9BACT|nr:RagB/SusD family nutrient uptake outer membrane protein [Carboxylicivirga marina]MBK3519664.1 RagB/SusD family nutrient uptake outer membrane protein [Carboxylicivirga marina]
MNKIYLILIAVLFLSVSCNDDILDLKPLDKYSEKDVWSDVVMAEAFIYDVYANTVPRYAWSNHYEQLSDNYVVLPWAGTNNIKANNYDRNYDAGWNRYGAIRMCNLAIEKISESDFSKNKKDQLLGEAKFLRALVYFEQVQKFGGVMLVDKVYSADEEDFQLPRATEKQCYDFILNDLSDASTLLPEAAQRGRASKGAAYAMSMRVALRAAAYLNDDSYCNTVIAEGDKLFALGKYSLVDDYSNLFNQYSTAVNNSESILILDKSEDNTRIVNTPMISLVPNVNEHSKILDSNNGTKEPRHPLSNGNMEAWPNLSPTQDLVDDYLVEDVDGVAKKWNETDYFTNGLNVYEKMYINRDARFYASLGHDSTIYCGNLIFTRELGNIAQSNTKNGHGTPTGYITRKGVYEDLRIFYSDNTSYCYQILRLGEAYLNYAEAALVLGDEATAREYMSKTFKSHGKFVSDITASGTDLWDAYKRERRVEMFSEGSDRFWSLLRWGKFENKEVVSELNQVLHGIEISEDGQSYSIIETKDNGGQDPAFVNRRYYYPIPHGERQANPNLEQNPGW